MGAAAAGTIPDWCGVIGVILAAQCLLGAFGCGDESAGTSSGESGGAGQSTSSSAGGGESCEPSGDDACVDCMRGDCCEALLACDTDPDCTACVTATDSEACERTEETHARVDAFLTCRGGDCQEACVGAIGACEGVLEGLVLADCQACLETNCCDQVAACHALETCWTDCFVEHTEAGCHADPDAHSLYHAMGACAGSKCSDVCN